MSPRHIAWFCAVIVAVTANAAPVAITDFADAVQPQVAVAPGGRIHVVFGKANAIFHASSSDGRAFSPPVKVGELDKLALRMRRGPRIAASDTSIVITAISHADGDLHAWTSADRGATWTEGARVNESAHSAREGLHAMAGDGRGLIAAVWLDSRSGRNQLWSRVSRAGGRAWEPEVRVYESPDGHICECCHPSVAIGPRGEIFAMCRNWLDNARDLWMAESRDGGRTFAAAQKLGAGTWKLNACPMDGGALAVGPTGAPAAVWRRERAIFAGWTGTEKKLAEPAAQPVLAGSPRLFLA
ncbi:MAG TPA: exo-alpha-sialidase, partial [Chthoniobacteraceae bacterium]|nr:exo-alpha-sialidase [Chthoniobacteraceae bacterium]